MTATEAAPAATAAPTKNEREPLSTKLRQEAYAIDALLKQYFILRYGDEDWRKGDAAYRTSSGEKGKPPGQFGVKPSITLLSSPQNIFAVEETEEEKEEETPQEDKPSQETSEKLDTPNKEDAEKSNKEKSEEKITNPFIHALSLLDEITPDEARYFELEVKYNILNELGIQERYSCNALFLWARRLAGHITYILETKEMYSPEIKAVYQELLMDLDIARSECDKLAHILGKQNGVLTKRQFTETIARILHYSEIAKHAALQLADQHEDYMQRSGQGILPSEEIEWVMKEEDKHPSEAEAAVRETDETEEKSKK